jgi:hypothetical protein
VGGGQAQRLHEEELLLGVGGDAVAGVEGGLEPLERRAADEQAGMRELPTAQRAREQEPGGPPGEL